MSKKSLPEILEENKRILTAKFQEGFLEGFKAAEQDLIPEFLDDLKAKLSYFTIHIWEMKLHDNKLDNFELEIEKTLEELIEKWENRKMEVE